MHCAVAQTDYLRVPLTAKALNSFSLKKKKKRHVEVPVHVTLTEQQAYTDYSCTLKFCTECLIGIL